MTAPQRGHDVAPIGRASGKGPGQRRLNGEQTSGREYRSLSPVEFSMQRTNSVSIPVRDGTILRAEVFLPTTGAPRTITSSDGSVDTDSNTATAPALMSFSCYPRQAQDLGAPLGFIEAGASDYFVPRGYAHVIVNARGTSGSDGVWGLGDAQERRDVYDVVEWMAAQPWCDGQVGGMGISYFAIAQLFAAVQRPPHLRAIFPFATLDDLYDAVWHRGVLNSGFFSGWMAAVGILSQVSDDAWHGHIVNLLRKALNTPKVHGKVGHVNGENALKVLHQLRAHFPEEPFGRLWQQACVEHPTHDAWWDERNIRAELSNIDIPVYLGCQWDNVPMHLPSSFPVWEHLVHNPNVRLTLLAEGGLLWPWETMHEEALAWNDHWLKGRDTGIMDGPPIRYVIPETTDWRTADQWPPAESCPTSYSLRADGTLSSTPGDAGRRSYLYFPTDSGRPRNANPPGLPDRLTWVSEAATEPLDIVGDIELELDATISALDTAWIAVLSDLAPDGTAVPITAGWLRAALRAVDEAASRPSRPVLPLREPQAVPTGEVVHYRIPMVPNARRIVPGHRLQLTIASADEGKDGPTMLDFTHTPVAQSSLNTIHSTSRLVLPVVPAYSEIDARGISNDRHVPGSEPL